MEAEKNLGQALLNQRSPEEIQHTDAERIKVMDVIGREKRDIRILKRVLFIYCGVAAVVFVAFTILNGIGPHIGDIVVRSRSDLGFAVWGLIFIGAQTAVPITIVLAVGIYLKGRNVSNLQIREELLRVQEELRKLTEAKRREG